MPSNTATYHLFIDIPTGEKYSLNSSGEAFDTASIFSQSTFVPSTFEITRNLSSKSINVTLPRLNDANETLQIALSSDALMNDTRVEYSIVVNNSKRVLLYGRVSEVTLTDSTMKMRVTSFLEDLKYSKVVKLGGVCRNVFGDSLCTFDTSTVQNTASIVAIDSDRLAFTVSETYTEGQYQDGVITLPFPAGRDLDIDIAQNDVNRVYLWEKLPELIAPGSTLTITQGCLKTEGACRAYNNYLNFAAIPEGGNFSPSILNLLSGAES